MLTVHWMPLSSVRSHRRLLKALILLIFAFALTLADLVGRLESRLDFYAGARLT